MWIRIKLVTYGGDIRNIRLAISKKDTFRQQGAKGAGIVFGLHAAHTINETMSYGDFNKKTVYTDKWQLDNFTASKIQVNLREQDM
jgi:hypothetical protein